MKRIVSLALMALAVFTLALNFVPRAAAQDIIQDQGPKQHLRLVYPDGGIALQGKGEDEERYKGTVYVKVYPVSPRLKKKFGEGPVYSNELEATGGQSLFYPMLPLGEYEVQFSMRDGDNLRTCIKRDILLTASDETTVTAEFSNSKILVIGGDHTLQQMEAAIGELAQRVLALQAEVDALKGKAVTPVPAPTETPAK